MNRRIIFTLSFGHLANDFLINVFTAILPLLVIDFHLSYGEVGVLTMASNVASSLVQPVFGWISDKKGMPWLLGLSALALSLGLLCVEFAPSFIWLIPAVVLNGIGSAAFHPDASRAVFFAAADKRGAAQSIFQVGGNLGLALSAIALRFLQGVGLSGIAWLMILGVVSSALLFSLTKWFAARLVEGAKQKQSVRTTSTSARTSKLGLSLLVFIVTVRSWIVSGFSTFVPLYVMAQFGVTAQHIWIYTFVFLLFGAIGTLAGGPMADRFGQRNVIRISMVVSTPLAVLMPYIPRDLVLVDLALVGFFLLSTFAVTVIYGQEMLPNNIAMVSGLLIGFAGGIAGLGIMLVGQIADVYSLHVALQWIVWLMPAAALCTLALPVDAARLRQRLPAALGTAPR
ncbi:MFS transporter [Alicyclobacillus fastidiosus]|uniref:MFS transporter n=1 Tax=Alicyclobacillus fastidiosus TaxID=392011 RepID=A0ABV5ACG7_9BACL|nr:MFS transporter [Alicyclobacillus fastidiosus]WEH11403.1 MFS transporter [Alicyclobacillus fastidiosus]